MVIRIRTLFIALIILIICIGFFLFFFLPKKSSLLCSTFKDRYPLSDCGYVSSSVDRKSTEIMGVVRKKYQKNNTYVFDMETKDAKERKVILPIAFPPETLKVAVTILTPGNQLSSTKNIDPTNVYKPADAWQKINLDQVIMINVINATELDVSKYQEKLGNQPFISCLSNNKQLTQYLQKPSLINTLQVLLMKQKNTCDITTFQIILHG